MNDYSMDHVGMAMSIINGRPLTDALLEEVLSMLSKIDAKLGQDELKRVRNKLESTIGIRMSVGEVMRESAHAPWVSDAKGTIEWHYWDSYKRLLASQGWSPKVVQVLDEDTDNILTECGNPAWNGSWAIRGLVMGDVQSGKTASYSGLIAKAADAGYRVIVLLTGMIEDLRRQTQERLDSGFVGRDSRDILGSRNTQAIGAGIYRNKSANVLTSVDFDFLANNAKVLGIPLANINEPILFVMKKNKAPLENLKGWLESQLKLSGHSKHQLPLLVIDDEADNASVNVRKEGEEPATINRLIRGIIEKFSCSSYVAYTATPFANVFINPDDETDLFPSNFIYSLNTPSHYIGASSIFLEGGNHYHQLKDIDDAEASFPYVHKKDHPVGELPDSLKNAVRVFLLSCAVRDIREEELRHRSMLVNVSRFTDVQARVSEKLRSYLWGLQEEIRQFLLSTSWRNHPDLAGLASLWQHEFSDTEVTWEQVRQRLYEAVASIKVVTINQKSAPDEKLDYSRFKNTEKGRRVIAVGGLTLSRGLTMEGLCVSYFYRNSKAYDTLLQMGRWFGYRPGYEDLFRIWMDSDAQDWYAHIADAVTELRTDFKRMSANRLPPSQFGIRVKSHPDTLIVTAQNKMRTAREVAHSVSFSAFGAETPIIPKSPDLNMQNVSHVAGFVRGEGAPKLAGNRYVWKGIPKKRIAAFLSELNISNMNMQFLPDAEEGDRPLVRFIEKNGYPQLDHWDVCIPQGLGNEVPGLDVPLSGDKVGTVRCRKRQFERTAKGAPYLRLNKQRVGDTSDERVEMPQSQINEADLAWQKEIEKDTKKGSSTPGYMYRRYRSTPLLTIHFIQWAVPTGKNPEKMLGEDEVGSDPKVAISLSFPDFDPLSKGEKVVYRLNKIALRDLFGEEEEEEDDNDTD
ncbi:Z1 domain-containing protein [Cupriavidus pauculus]|uniref:Z1 domain-containing protein n=1 Tax=Cupriavidus pauculus TaxID=82633 RepID=UPI001EE18D37|nr:Z1 domain-containing protein [Cupriavidus pauculus]GJG98558.1 Z1 domain-containing protein [Cupriavidus pauculus]